VVKSRLQTAFLLAAAAACLVLLYRHFFPNEEAVIRRQLARLAEHLSVPAHPTTAGNLAAADHWRDALAAEIGVDVEVLGEGRHTLSGRQEVIGAMLAARGSLGGLKVQFVDVLVSLDPGRQTATVNLTVRATQPRQRDLFAQEAKLTLRKEERRWRILRAETVRTLKL
jgi:hypothetical protein